MRYKIYQCSMDTEYKFFGLDIAQKHGLSMKHYKEVYSGDVNCSTNVYWTLEKLFEIFNCDHPEGYKGHSMSVSDIIELDGILYYCDSLGFKQISKEFRFKVSIASGGFIKVNAIDNDEAYAKALEYVGKRLYEAFPELDISYDVEEIEDETV